MDRDDGRAGSGQKSKPGDADFSTAVLAIMALPLTDNEKAEAIRRMLLADVSI